MKSRHLVPELMDDPNLDEWEHQRALAGLRRINRLCVTGRHIAHCIRSHYTVGQEIRILDLGCGSGDIALDVTARLQPFYQVSMTGWDISPIAIKVAGNNLLAHRLHSKLASNVTFEQRNVLDASASCPNVTNPGTFDIVYCTLFMHHFTDKQSIDLLGAMRKLSKGIVVVDDLKRSQFGWFMAKIGCHLLSRSPVVHFDGPQSVRAAFLPKELVRLAEQAGLRNVKAKQHWPERFLCCWNVS